MLAKRKRTGRQNHRTLRGGIWVRLGRCLSRSRRSVAGGEPAETPEWIGANVDDILAALEVILRRDRRDVRRLPHRLLWLLDDVAPSSRHRDCILDETLP